MTAHGDNVVVFRVDFGDAVAQTAHQRVDGLFAHTFADGIRPDCFDDIFARADSAAVMVQQFEQTVLRRAERSLSALESKASDSHRRVRLRAAPLRSRPEPFDPSSSPAGQA